MKFHSIKVENLNSLYGTHEIDLSRDVRNAPLFLIIGRTGAGKSTILDGVSLALFGKTPRLEQQRGANDTDVGHIMSAGTAHAAAELVFSVRNPDGTRDRFKAKWSCRRSHDDPDGTVQRPERALSRWKDGGWELIVSDHRIKEFDEPFRQALRGLNVEDFRRTILLAQGDFAALLHASEDEKAVILERLTSTEVYQEIGARAAQKRRDAERSYYALKKELEQTEVLGEEARAELVAEMEAVARAGAESEASLETIGAAIERERRRAGLVEALDGAGKRLEETKEAVKDLEPKIERLERDAKLRPVESAYRALVAAEEAGKSSRKAVEEATEAFEKLEVALAAAVKERDGSAKKLEDLEAKWKELDPKLEAASRVEAQLEKAHEELESARENEAELARLRDELADRLEAGREGVEKAKRERDAAREERAKLPAADEIEGLGAALRVQHDSAIEPAFERLEALQPDDEADGGANLTALRARHTKAKNKLAEIAPELGAELGPDLAPDLAKGALDALAQEIADAIAAKREQRDALIEATFAMKELKVREDKRAEVVGQLEELDQEIEREREKLDAAEELLAERRERIGELRRSVRLAQQMMVIGDLRDQLEDGEPCPLCGSPVHPFCMSDEIDGFDRDARAEHDDFVDRLAQAEESGASQERAVALLKTGLTSKTTSRAHYDGQIAEFVTIIEENKKTFVESAEKGGFPPLEVWNLRQGDQLSTALEDAKETLKSLEERAEKLRLRRGDWDRATEDLRQAEQAESDTRRLAKSIEEAEAERDRQLEEFGQKLEILGVARPSPTAKDVRAGLAAAEARLKLIASATEALGELEKGVETAEKAVEADLVELKRKRSDARQALEALASRAHTVAAFEKRLRELLPEGTPAELREARAEAFAAARAELEAAREATEKVKSTHDQRAGTLKERKEALEKGVRELEAAEAKWAETSRAAGVVRDDVAAGLLDLETRAKLQREVEEAREAKNRAAGALETAQKSLETFLAAAGAVVAELDTLLEEQARVRSWRDAFAQHRGALRERKEQDDRRREDVAERQDELELRRKEHDRWLTLARLIGTGEGAAFRTFAQSLNLQGLVDRANARLAHLSPRYELAVARGEQGEPTLDFSVRDAFKAGHERPLTTLSGGETFLVSLALALALSDYRRIELPVETLLLDEGFGTLDQDSLHMAVDTLQRLHQDSTRQVGIISHVEALKEMIDARIVVEKQGNGRSSLRFEVSGVASGAHDPVSLSESVG